MTQTENQQISAIKKEFPIVGFEDVPTFPALCHGQCRYEQEKEYREMLHELRNSLGGVVLGLTNIETHWSGMTFSDFMRTVRQIKEMATFMGDMINRYSLSGAEGQDSYTPEELDVTTVVAQAVKNYSARATAKHIHLTFHPLVLSTIILGDRASIRQIVENLISNAIKFSPMHSSVDVFVAVSSVSAAAPHLSEQWEIPMEENEAIRFVRVEVHDNGPGVTMKDKKHLFERGVVLSARPTGGESSSGLGLSIVKKLTDMAGGQVWCESRPEEGISGSKFIVEFLLFKEM